MKTKLILISNAVSCAINGTVRRLNEQNNLSRLLRVFMLACVVSTISACDDDEGKLPDPEGPKPVWGPTITDEMLLVIEKLDELSGGVPLQTLSAVEARKAPTAADAVMAVMKENNIPTPPSKADTVGYEVPVEGGTVHARVYTPKNATGNLPAIVYYHGGGWVIAGIDTYDASIRALSDKVGAVVVAVAYRKAPEFKYPTAHNDSFTAYKWVLANASKLKIDGAKVAVAGESAGGNLAGAVSLMARDNDVQMPVHQLLVYPIAGYDFNTPSYQKYAEAKPLSKPLMMWFFDKYLNNPSEGNNPWVALVQATDLSGLPSATVINAEIDPLQSEGQAYAQNLKAAGVSVTSKVYQGVTHEFFGMAAVVPEAKAAQDLAAKELKTAFAK